MKLNKHMVHRYEVWEDSGEVGAGPGAEEVPRGTEPSHPCAHQVRRMCYHNHS